MSPVPLRLGRRRSASPAPRLTPDDLQTAWQAASLLIGYPDEQLIGRLDQIENAVGGIDSAVSGPVLGLVAHLRAHDLGDLQQEYVETFDFTRKCSLYLTYFTMGDTRKRGVALVQLKQAYRRGGLELGDDELADHLGVVLEFGALADWETAWSMLVEHRAGLEALRLALTSQDSPWLGAVEAVCATLPALDATGRDAVRQLIENGPASEEVGLAPYQLDPGAADLLGDGPWAPAEQPAGIGGWR